MCKRLWIGFAFTVMLSAQELRPLPDRTTPPSDAHYEIVQSPVLAKLTFKLDRYSGLVWQLVLDKHDQESWELMKVEGPEDSQNSTRPRFQIFMSGRNARSTFLLDTLTGKAWQYVVVDKEKDLVVWQIMADNVPPDSSWVLEWLNKAKKPAEAKPSK